MRPHTRRTRVVVNSSRAHCRHHLGRRTRLRLHLPLHRACFRLMAVSYIALSSTQKHLAAWLGVSFATVNRWKDGATPPQKAAQGCHCPPHTRSRGRRKQRRVTTEAQVGRHSRPPRACQRTVAVHQAHETDAVGHRLLPKRWRWRWPVKRKRCRLASPTLSSTPTNNVGCARRCTSRCWCCHKASARESPIWQPSS